jgi:thiosulfate/3-mercaptopyruvate sulfurtransferase
MRASPLLVGVDSLDAGEGAVVADVRWYLDGRSGRAAYESGHIPGAVFVDLDVDLSTHGAPSEGRHPLPAPEQFATAMSRRGIGAGSRVIAYDDSGGGTAGRLVWMLRAQGVDASLLDGGLRAWDGPLEAATFETAAAPDPIAPRPWPAELLASYDDVTSSGGGTVLLDARAAERYRGESESVDPRAGHIPGAVNAPWADALDPASGRFRDADALRAWLVGLGATPGNLIASCGSGVSACVLIVAAGAAGLGPVRLFVPSWSGWSSDPERQIATGALP